MLAALVGGLFLLSGCVSEQPSDEEDDPPGSAAAVDSGKGGGQLAANVGDPVRLSGVSRLPVDQQLVDQLDHLDPAEAGWESEAFSEQAGGQLKQLGKLLAHPEMLDADHVAPLLDADFQGGPLRPEKLTTAFEDDGVLVRRRDASSNDSPRTQRGVTGMVSALGELLRPLQGATDCKSKLKIVGVTMGEASAETDVYLHVSGRTRQGPVQINATWRCRWKRRLPPRLLEVEVRAHEEVTPGRQGRLQYDDATALVLGANPSFQQQILRGYDHWRMRSDRALVSDLAGNHGVAVGDVDGDGLDDVYLTQPGGLPNRLFRHNADGTATDISAEMGLDLLDFSRSALVVDLDNDGDGDLVVGLAWRILIFENHENRRFTMHAPLVSHGQVNSLSAADYDNDGDLDLFVCGRFSDGALSSEQQILGLPLPIHDANNGGPNTLLRNDGSLRFSDVTAPAGLDANNRRFTLAAAWEDYDNDGDQDLYVANDFGRNNFYRNDGGRFVDVAATAGVEDVGPGMSVTWGDYNGDGLVDLYVSNMFSSAGGRITTQSQFMPDADEATRAMVARFARGNSLYQNTGDGRFRDVTLAAGVNVGRWAWSSNFVDLNNDGREDIVVANGFITAEDPDDL